MTTTDAPEALYSQRLGAVLLILPPRHAVELLRLLESLQLEPGPLGIGQVLAKAVGEIPSHAR